MYRIQFQSPQLSLVFLLVPILRYENNSQLSLDTEADYRIGGMEKFSARHPDGVSINSGGMTEWGCG
jgi:hypothetical protein